MSNDKEYTLAYYFKDYLRERKEENQLSDEEVEKHLLHFIQFFDAIKAHAVDLIGTEDKDLFEFTDSAFIVLCSLFSNEYDIDTKEFVSLIKTFSPSKLIRNFKSINEEESLSSAENYVPMLLKTPANEDELSMVMSNVTHYLYQKMISNTYTKSTH